MSKKFFKSFLSSLLALLMIVSFAAIPSSAATISLSKSSLSLTKGYATTLKVSGTSNTVTWSTGDKSIATVTSKGKVAGKSVGTTYIYAKVSSKTLKCKVTVVAGKITVGSSSVSLNTGDKTTVNVKALGTHVISASSTDKSVVKATWSGAKFNGNDIKLTLTAVGNGTARVKVYAKNYPSTIYKYITVTVGNDELTDDDTVSDSDVTIVPLTETVTVDAKASTTIKVYASELNSIAVKSSNTGIATATVSTSTTKYIPIKVTGVAAGTTTLKVYQKNDVSNYVTINVTVGSTTTYYSVLATYPSKLYSTDSVVQFSSSTATKYMLVPYGYDNAYVNSLIASYLGYYSYYKVYDVVPTRILSTDIVKTVSTTFNNKAVTRYMMYPSVFDQVQVDTEIAKYTNVFSYYKAYTSSPARIISSDEIMTWTKTVTSGTSTTTSTRYMLVPYGMTDSTKAIEVKNADLGIDANAYYTTYTEEPTRISTSDVICIWTDFQTMTTRYMLIPNTTSIPAKNDTVYSTTLTRYYFTVYSSVSFSTTYASEQMVNVTYKYYDGSVKQGYMLIDTANTNAAALVKTGVQGTYNSAYPQK